MFSSETNLPEEQIEILNNFLSQFQALQESFSNALSLVENNLNEKLSTEIGHALAHADAAIKAPGEEIRGFMDTQVVLKAKIIAKHRAAQASERRVSRTGTRASMYAPDVTNEDTASRTQSGNPLIMLKVKEPQPFSGKANQCNAFFSQLTMVLSGNPLRFESEQVKIFYAISYMTHAAFAYMEPYLQNIDSPNPPEILFSSPVFKDTRIKAFGDTNPVVNAEASIRALKQNGPVSV
ncbi:hypothetical protein [Parasitella parasitica]|uniref:DUF4939 domain-containing protein n=1 Tax=Parasitella parasitica TaxID=35722 RepID=A0A0B7MZS8_9FUNG|nr:hypothetical protein [Parasitella parasitica]